ncbi:MAG: hypothetical protein K0S33_2790 [Bacteroidetes bacterium]|jgi:hypothetical protein|nr:hypothetical protein [Bacteroidota bacterium]
MSKIPGKRKNTFTGNQNDMKKLFLFALLLIVVASPAQKYNAYDEGTKDFPSANVLKYTIYSVEYKVGKTRIEEYIRIKGFTVINQHETKDSHHYEFSVQDKEVAAIDSFCATLGYVSSKNLNSYNNQAKLAETQLELERLEIKKAEYEKMLVKIDSVKSERYYQHWEKIRDIEMEIYNAKKKIGKLESVKNMYTVSIDMNDEQSSPTNSKVNFVHMPGAEYVYLFTENPKQGISYASYQGVYLKYLFTKGKSYFSLGALKANGKVSTDSTAYDELFTFTFGQDWYSRHLGRGNNKFMNLYIGYQAGYSIAYSDEASKGIFYASPSTGIELFKNKYFLFDTNVNYYLPISSENRNMRGWRVGTSLNFSF